MKYIRNTCLFTLIIAVNILNAQEIKSDLIISGRIDSSILKEFKSYELYLFNRTTKYEENERIIKVIPITRNGSFKDRIALEDSLIYLSIKLKDNRDSAIFKGTFYSPGSSDRYHTNEVFLFQQGDSVRVQIKADNTLFFSGKGSNKLNCQAEIYAISTIPLSVKSRIIKLSANENLDKLLLFMDESIDQVLQLKLSILKSYKNDFSSAIYNMLFLDAIGSTQLAKLQQYEYMKSRFSIPSKQRIKTFYKTSLKRENSYKIDSASIHKSAYYTDMLLERDFNFFNSYGLNKEYTPIEAFKLVYLKLSSNYKDELRDKLLYTCFRKIARRSSTEATALVSKAINNIHTKRYYNLINEWKSKQKNAFPFELQDAEEKVHKLKDYRGKLLVIDFWFVGCRNCTILARAMHPIFQKYKDNKNIVFLTVSTDPKHIWLKGLSSGEYTSPDMINLYTQDRGWNHPLIEYYGFAYTGFPRQLIIGKNGELIDATPPRPNGTKEKASTFMKIIDANLMVK